MSAPERRALVLRAAADAFRARGYDGTRLDDVAAAAGVTKPIVYRHFGSKDDLYLALLDAHEQDLPAFFARMPPPAAGAPIDAILRAVLAHWLAYVAGHRHAWVMLYRDAGGGAVIDARRRAVRARARALLAAFLRERADPPLPEPEVEPLAEILVSGLAGLALTIAEGDAEPTDAMADAAVRTVLGVLGVDCGAAHRYS